MNRRIRPFIIFVSHFDYCELQCQVSRFWGPNYGLGSSSNLISGILAIVFDGFGSFFSVGFVFTRTTPIFGLCGVWTTPSAQAAAIINLAVVAADGADLKPQRQKIGVVLVKTKTTEKNQPNLSKTVAKMPIIRFLVSLPAGNLS